MYRKKANKKIGRSVGSAFARTGLRIFLLLWSITILLPIVWLVYSSFKDNREFYASPWTLPSELRFENYVSAWDSANISAYFLNSIILVVGTLFLFTLLVTTTSYILAKYKTFFTKIFKVFYFFAMMIPSSLLLVPLYFQFYELNLTNNLFVLMVIYAVQGIPLPIFLLSEFMANIDDAFIEAATIDGASEFVIFSRVVLPFVKPILFFLCLGNIMGTWNEYVTALTFLKDEALYTVPIGISYLVNQMNYRVEFGSLFAALVMAMIPILILYAIFQKQILNGMGTSDGLKG